MVLPLERPKFKFEDPLNIFKGVGVNSEVGGGGGTTSVRQS